MAVEVQLFGLVLDETTRSPVVILRAVEGEETLPIQVGIAEAAAIAAAIERVDLPRPMTHDLMLGAIEALGATVEAIQVVDLRDGTFYGRVVLKRGRRRIELDARPSDGIALALRAGVPIMVEDEVFRKAGPQDVAEASRQQWMVFLSSLEASAAAAAGVGGEGEKKKDEVQ